MQGGLVSPLGLAFVGRRHWDAKEKPARHFQHRYLLLTALLGGALYQGIVSISIRSRSH